MHCWVSSTSVNLNALLSAKYNEPIRTKTRQDLRHTRYIGLFHAFPFVFRLFNTLLKHTQHRNTRIYRQELRGQTRISSGWNLFQPARCNWYCRARYESWNKLRIEVAKSVTKGSFFGAFFRGRSLANIFAKN